MQALIDTPIGAKETIYKVIDYFFRDETWVLATQTSRGYGVHFFDGEALIEWYSSRSAFENGDGPFNMSQFESPDAAVRALLES